ncbi:MAG TPA: sulfite reductase flavoprotein subunit alpha [Janthinobacterium sp.]|nr:sulfite reductase flavoprotein subunit alpha [Janthinobacterium sp.]
MPDDQGAAAAPLPPLSPAATPARRLPPLKRIWSQLHWFIGITAGTVLVVIGLSGAILSFREEWLDLLNPGVRSVPVRAAAALTPAQIGAAVLQARGPDAHVANITVFAEAGLSARVALAPPPGQRKGETVYADPYTGALQPPLRGCDAFEWVEALHRWLLLPRETGRGVAGTLACCLLLTALSGLYLRWPRRPLAWRSWLTFDPRLRGRSFLWGLHSVLGSWMLLVYLVSAASGIYWSFDLVRDNVDAWAGGRAGAQASGMRKDLGKDMGQGGDRARAGKDGKSAAPVDLEPAWSAFQRQAGGWSMATLRMPERATQALQVTWLGSDAPHERARNRMWLQQAGGKVLQDERYAQQGSGAHFLAVIYPLHMGTYFGLPGRIAMMLGGLSLPGFAITGWMLYLGRRRQKRAVLAERALLAGAAPAAATSRDARDTLLLAYASQSGQAERLALHSAGALRRAGLAVSVAALDGLDPAALRHYRRALFVASSFGEGEAPDGARRFARLLRQGSAAPAGAHGLHGLHYGVLALGDRHYAQFCGFGHTLDQGLRSLGAQPLFPLIEVDNGDAAALARWSQALAELSGSAQLALAAEDTGEAREAEYGSWRLLRRELLNPGSQGGALVEVTLVRAGGAGLGCDWQPGAVAEVLPRHAPPRVAGYLLRSGLSGAAQVRHGGAARTLAEALARSVLPPPQQRYASAQACADGLKALAPRSYSLASLVQDGELQLLVRQERHEQGLGLASGWLTAQAPLGGEIELRLAANPGFGPPPDDAPCIFIGNGSGFAGLRAHLRHRERAGQRRNWLLFGERQRAHDRICSSEIGGWLAGAFLQRLDLVFSREPSGRAYVQDRLRDAHDEVRTWVARGALIYVCGSMKGMASGVDAALAEILGRGVLEDLIAEGRYRRDVY